MQFKHTLLTIATLFLFGTMFAGSAVHGDVPAFVKESLYSPNAATVAKVTPMLQPTLLFLMAALSKGYV